MKRKYEELDDSDSEEPSFGKQILPIADLSDDFDGDPVDGMQYLFTVRRDAKALPHVTRVPNPYESTTEPSITDSFQKQPHPAIPSMEWRQLTEMRWTNLRKNFSQPTIGPCPPTSGRKLMPDKKERDLWWHFLSGKPEHVWNPPKSKKKNKLKQNQHSQPTQGHTLAWDDQGYEHGESGRGHENERNHAKQGVAPLETSSVVVDVVGAENTLKSEPQDFLPTPTGTPVPSDTVEQMSGPGPSSLVIEQDTESDYLTPREPSPQLLMFIDERVALHLLMYFAHWINLYLHEPNSPTYRPTNVHARWMFSLLLRIDDYISADDMNLLRNLARACLAYLKLMILDRTRGVPSESHSPLPRKSPDIRVMDERACWIIICAIVGVWGQRDLWVDAEDALSSCQ